MLTDTCVFNPIALRKAKIIYNFGLSECNRVRLLRGGGDFFFFSFSAKKISTFFLCEHIAI